MSIFGRNLLLLAILAIVAGCTGVYPTRWGHFHGNLSNQGLHMVESGFALSSNWISKSYRITSSSPVIGSDFQDREIVYIGSSDGALLALSAEDGSEKWRKPLAADGSQSRIISSPAVSEKRNIYVISSRRTGDRLFESTLHKIDQFSNRRWSYTFPDNGFSSGSPKVVTTPKETLVFVYLVVNMDVEPRGDLFVLRDGGSRAELVDRRSLATCRYESSGSGSIGELLDYYADTWDLVGSFPPQSDENGVVLPDLFIDPTVAIVDGPEKLLIAIADNLCSVGAFEWDGSRLAPLWRQEHKYQKHSSAAISPEGLMIFGNQDGIIQAYDVQAGVKMWEFEAGNAAFATPGIAEEKFVFVVSKNQIQVLNISDGSLAHDEKSTGRLPLLGLTHSSPAVTADRVYLSTFEMLTVTYDFKTRGHDTNFHGNGLSSVAIGHGGSVYAVAADGTVHKYAGTE